MDSIENLYSIFQKCKGVEIDSRKVVSEQLFFAFRGENTDGHKYVDQVVSKPGCFAVIDDESYSVPGKTILVEDTLSALQKLARHHRDQFDVPVFALTGSNGKTTTKELIMAVLSTKYEIHATKGNYNNHIGVPLTLLSAPREADILIIEMGANKLGDIDELCEIADPFLGLITNIGTAHIGTFGSQENILLGKTELYRHIARHEDGVLFVNKFDELLLDKLPENLELCLYPDEDIEIIEKDMVIEIKDLEQGRTYVSKLTGLYNAMNIHAALAIGNYFNVDRNKSLKAIEDYVPSMNRSEIRELGSTRIILDAYNANPTSMKASINSVSRQADASKVILVLGDMLELGDREVSFHKEILEMVKDEGFNKVILVGPLFMLADNDQEFEHYSDIESAVDYYKDRRSQFDNKIILLKASRSLKLEKFIEIF